MQDDDLQLQSYQDDLNDDDNATDPLMEEGDDPSKELGVPPEELKSELDKEFDDEDEPDDDDIDIHDDEREYIEDQDDVEDEE